MVIREMNDMAGLQVSGWHQYRNVEARFIVELPIWVTAITTQLPLK